SPYTTLFRSGRVRRPELDGGALRSGLSRLFTGFPRLRRAGERLLALRRGARRERRRALGVRAGLHPTAGGPALRAGVPRRPHVRRRALIRALAEPPRAP